MELAQSCKGLKPTLTLLPRLPTSEGGRPKLNSGDMTWAICTSKWRVTSDAYAKRSSVSLAAKPSVPPMEVWLSPDSEYKGLSADQINLVNRMFQSKLTEVMEPEYPIVSQPGNDVMVLRVALTNVNIKNNTECTGFAANITQTPDKIANPPNI